MKGHSDKICWCCLKTDGDMKSLLQNPLKEDYLNLAGIKTCSWEAVPLWLCLVCAREIKKARAFQISAKNSYTFLMLRQSQQHNIKIKEETVGQNSPVFKNVLPCLSQSVLELWNTPEEQMEQYDAFVMEELDIKNESSDSDSKPLIKLEMYDENSSKLTSGNTTMCTADQSDEFEKLDVKVKRKKNKKAKKKKTKTKDKSSSVVLQNRKVLETKQYKVLRLTPEQAMEERKKSLDSSRYREAPHKCELCAKGYNYEDVLINHMARHEHQLNHLECKICHQFFPTAVSLRGHMKSHLVRYECRECGAVRASRQHLLEHHALQHKDGSVPPKRYTCKVCGKTIMKRTMFQKHVKLHSPASRLPCEKCGKSFKSIETLRAHKLRHAEVKHYKCPECPREFRYASLLYTHRITHITTRNFYCVECDLSFKTQSNLRSHFSRSQKHIDPSTLKFNCNECSKRYPTESQLKHHIECFHLGKREHTCPSCDKQYASKDGLRAHVRREHPPPGVTPPPIIAKHICDICSRPFKAKAVLIKHIRTHTGERPFQCIECLRAFSQQSTLTTHIKLVHMHMKKKIPNRCLDGSKVPLKRKVSNPE